MLLLLISNLSQAQLKVLTNGPIQGGLNKGALRIESINGKTLDIGAQNDDFAHFFTNSTYGFIFASNLWVKGYIRSYNMDLKLNAGGATRLTINELNGNVGIGTNYNPSMYYKLDVDGNILCGVLTQDSDERLKKDKEKLPKDKIPGLYDLNGWSYKLKSKIVADKSDTTVTDPPVNPHDTTTKFGLLAQEVQSVYPELVYEDEKGYLSLNYTGFIPILIEALKEQKEMILALQEKEKTRETESETATSSEGSVSTTETGTTKSSEEFLLKEETEAILGQNQPNPFSENTYIELYIPELAENASFYIYDMQGKQLKSYTLPERGNTGITIQGSELPAGMYYYSLIMDGKIIGTKQMILTD